MLMSMVVAFTITPWLAYHGLRRKYAEGRNVIPTTICTTWTPSSNRRFTRSSTLMAPLLGSRLVAWSFLVGILVDRGSDGLAAARRTAQDAAV